MGVAGGVRRHVASKTNSGDNPRWRFIFCFQEKHVPGILGRVLVILNSKIMKILIIYGIFGFKNQFWRQPGWRYFFCFQKKHVPGILGRVLVISNSNFMKILIIYGIYENPDYGIGIGISIGIYIYNLYYIISPLCNPEGCTHDNSYIDSINYTRTFVHGSVRLITFFNFLTKLIHFEGNCQNLMWGLLFTYYFPYFPMNNQNFHHF